MLRGLYLVKHLGAMPDSLSRGKRQMLRKPFSPSFLWLDIPQNNKELYYTEQLASLRLIPSQKSTRQY